MDFLLFIKVIGYWYRKVSCYINLKKLFKLDLIVFIENKLLGGLKKSILLIFTDYYYVSKILVNVFKQISQIVEHS